MIKNEKYTGNSLLQKKFVSDHLTKLLLYNKGQLPKYYAEGTHQAIIDFETFQKAQLICKNNYKKIHHKTPTTSRYVFSGLIKCGICGKNYRRKVGKVQTFWCCSTYLTKGKHVCGSKHIPENVLFSIVKSIFMEDNFTKDLIKEKFEDIVVNQNGTVTFIAFNGEPIEFKWEPKSRSESWTFEKRQKAKEKQAEILKGGKNKCKLLEP